MAKPPLLHPAEDLVQDPVEKPKELAMAKARGMPSRLHSAEDLVQDPVEKPRE